MSDKYTSIPIHRPRVRTTKTFLLVWLHNSTDTVNNNDYQNIIIELQQAVSGVHRFTDADEMVDFITDVAEEPIVLILSEVFVQTMISVAHEIPQVECVYILNENNVQCEQWSNKWRKMKGIYSDIKSIGEALIETSKIYNQDAISISFICACEEASDKNLNQLESSFMYTKIITEILFTIDFDRQHIEEFFAYCDGISTVRPRDIEMLRNEYHLHSPIWWYTHPCGLHNLLNYAIRVMDAEVMIRIGFFMRDLHQNITHLHSQQYPNYNRSSSFVVYRGQGLARADFEKLIKSKGGLLSFNSFLSTSKSLDVTLIFAETSASTPNMVGILFVMSIDPSILSTPFADITEISFFRVEEEILFSMHSIFRIHDIKQLGINDNLYQVNLILTSETDPDLHTLSEHIRTNSFPHKTGWYRLGNLLIQIGQFNYAQELFKVMLNQTQERNGRLQESWTPWDFRTPGFQKSGTPRTSRDFETLKSKTPKDSKRLHKTSKDSPELQRTSRDYVTPESKISMNFKKDSKELHDSGVQNSEGLPKELQGTPINRSSLDQTSNEHEKANIYHMLGIIKYELGDYINAIEFYEKSIEINRKLLPRTHLDLAASYRNLGIVYDKMAKHSINHPLKEKPIETIIAFNDLPFSTSDSDSNNDLISDSMDDYSKAVLSFENALIVLQQTFPPDDLILVTFYELYGTVYEKLGDYHKALSLHKRALEIKQKHLPSNHPSLATSYANHGTAYEQMGDIPTARSFYRRALDIGQRSLPSNHPDLRRFREMVGND